MRERRDGGREGMAERRNRRKKGWKEEGMAGISVEKQRKERKKKRRMYGRKKKSEGNRSKGRNQAGKEARVI